MEPAGRVEQIRFSREPSIALEEMMTHYGTTVIRTAYFYTGDRHLAEDISQDVFVRAYRNWHNFRGESSVKTWLARITVNVCRDRMRLRMTTEEPTDPDSMHGIQPAGVEEEVMQRLSRSTILQHVMRLPVKYREAIYLFYYLELSTKEIAETIGAPEGTVRGRIHRAREKLANQLLREELEQ